VSDITSNICSLKQRMPAGIKLVAVSKSRTPDEIMEAYSTGHRCFGENRVQELLLKVNNLPADIEWHLVGHLQSNKVRYIAPFIAMIQSVDSLKLMRIINEEARRNNRKISCLLQIHIAKEESKFGFTMDDLKNVLQHEDVKKLPFINICGVMGMSTFTDDQEQIGKEFRMLVRYFTELKSCFFADSRYFNEISMGMSDDYEIAIKEGSTMIRVGSLIFGERK